MRSPDEFESIETVENAAVYYLHEIAKQQERQADLLEEQTKFLEEQQQLLEEAYGVSDA